MSQREDKFQKLVFDFGEGLFDFPDATKYIFLGVGGVGFLVYYFRKKILEF